MQQLLNCSAMHVSRELQDGRLTGTPYCRRSQALRLNAQCKYYCSTGVPCPCSCKAFPHMLCLSKPCHCTDALQRQLPGCGSSSCRLATYCNVMHTRHMQRSWQCAALPMSHYVSSKTGKSFSRCHLTILPQTRLSYHAALMEPMWRDVKARCA